MRPSFRPVLALGLFSGPLLAVEPVDFAAKIAPLFEEHCVDCHSNDDPDGEFSLETFEALLKGGKAGRAIEPGKAHDSLLVKFLEGRSGKEGKNKFMPPGKNAHLKPEEIALIRQWIDAGARPPVAPLPPADLLAKLPKIAPTAPLKNALHALAFNASANLLAAGSFGRIELLDAATRQAVRRLEGIAGKVNGLVFSRDGAQLFAAAGDAGISGIAYQWRVSDGTLVRKFEGHGDALYALALSPDGQTLATGSYDQRIKLWNVADGAELRMLKGHIGGVSGLSFRPDGKVLASASADRTIKLWDVATGKRLDTFSQPLKEQTAVAFSPDGQTLAAGGADNRLRLWAVSGAATEGSNALLFTRFAHEGTVLNLAFAEDGRTIISTAADKTAKLWNAADLSEVRAMETQPDWPPALALLAGQRFALGRLDGSLGFYDIATGQPAPAAPPAAMPAKPAAKAAVAKPEITRLVPRGAQSGAVTKIQVTGKNLTGLTGAKFGQEGLTAAVDFVDPSGTAATLSVTAAPKLPRASASLRVITAAGESAPANLAIDDLPQTTVALPGKLNVLDRLPINLWGTLAATGQQDSFRFTAKKGETITFDLAAKRVESKALTARLEILDDENKLLAANNGLDSGADPFLAFTAPRDGNFTARVLEVTLEGSPDHAYRLTVGALPYVTGWWPLSVPANREADVHLVGHNLPKESVRVKAGADGEFALPLEAENYRSLVAMKVLASALPELLEQEPNDALPQAQALMIPASVNGRLVAPGAAEEVDADLYSFDVEAGQRLVIETRAAMLGSPADTKIEVLDARGEPIPQVLLQATKDSWLTLRSTDANAGGIRLGQFDEMALDDLMYFNGEVLKIFRLARGPDADMNYYTRDGKRRALFSSSPAGHGLDEPCYVVEAKPPGSKLSPNGLPVFTLNYSNDDDGERQLGRDSRVIFTAPAEGRYHVRVSDTRGWSGARFAYRLIIRAPQQDFSAKLVLKSSAVLTAGNGLQFLVKVDRQDGFEGDVRVDVSGVPDGFFVSSPVIVPAGHLTNTGVLFAAPTAQPGALDLTKVKLTATAAVGDQTVTHDAGLLPNLTVAQPAKQIVFIEPDTAGKPRGDGKTAPAQPFEITLEPGGRVPAWLRLDRRGNDALVGLDVEGLPHGVIVDSIGLSGVGVRAGESEREIFLSCAKWVKEQECLVHAVVSNARASESVEGVQASFPILLKIRKAAVPAVASAK